MHWKTKSIVQRLVGVLPRSHDLNFLLQRHVTHSLPASPIRLREEVEVTNWLVTQVLSTVEKPLRDQTWLEFGAGWHLGGALARTAAGVTSQLLYDLNPTARVELIKRAIADFAEFDVVLPEPSGDSIEAVMLPLGVQYHAPSDVRSTGLSEGSVDVICSTSVLEHVPYADIEKMLVEFRRVLSPQGVCAFVIDYHDHWAGGAGQISGVNFLRYSSSQWARWNCDLQHQNRLRHGDYVSLFEAAGFDLVVEQAIEDPQLPLDPPLDAEFRGRDDLRIGDGRFILRAP